MKQKSRKKKIQSSKILYLKLKHSLSLQKNGIKLQCQNDLKTKRKSVAISSKDITVSHSLNLNDQILRNQQETYRINDFANLCKQNIRINNQGNYSKNQQKKTNHNQRESNKFFYYQVSKSKESKKNQLKLDQQKKNRTHNFFKPKNTKLQFNPQQIQNATYSFALKDLQNSVDNFFASKSQISKRSRQKQSPKFKKCQNCSQKVKTQPQCFKNQEIKKLIQISKDKEQQKKIIFNHFPEQKILNRTYFNASQKDLVNRISSNNVLSQFNKMKFFLSKNRRPNHNRCASCQKSTQQKKKLSVCPSNFQYFVYEYKTTGHSTSKDLKNNQNIKYSQPKMIIKRKIKFQHLNKNINNQENYSLNEINLASVFDDFIHHRKIDVPQRPYTASVKSSTQIFHIKPSTCKNFHSKRIQCEQNFVKPWESSCEVDQFF